VIMRAKRRLPETSLQPPAILELAVNDVNKLQLESSFQAEGN
jgi:hypothetical protein